MIVPGWDESPTPPAGSPSMHTKPPSYPAMIIRIRGDEQDECFCYCGELCEWKDPPKDHTGRAHRCQGKGRVVSITLAAPWSP